MKTLLIAAAATLFASAAFAEPVTVNICTGGAGKPYFQTAEQLSAMLTGSKNIKLNIVETNGTWDNIDRTVGTAKGCDVMVGQPDGPALLKRKNPAAAARLKKIGDGPVEYLHVLCNKDSDIKNLSDLAGDNSKSVALGADGSGAWLIWQNFINEDKSYADIQTVPDSGAIALSEVANGDISCALVPAALGNATVLQADQDFGESLVLAGATDKDFNDAVDADGKTLYNWRDIPSGTYPQNLQSGWFSSEETIVWQAGIYVDKTAFGADKQKALEDLIVATARIKPWIKATFGSLK